MPHRPLLPRLPVLTLLLLMALPAGTFAQVNVEKMRSGHQGFRLTLGDDLAAQTGNSDLIEVGGQTRLDYRNARHYAFLVGNVRYGKQGDRVFKNRAFLHLRYNYELTRPVIAEAFGQLEEDAFTRLQLRTLLGAGVRLRLVETDAAGLYLGSSVMLEHERLDPAKVIVHPDRVTAPRWSNYVSLQFMFGEKVSLVNTLYMQPRFDAFDDYRILDEAEFSILITEHLGITIAFYLRHDSLPPDGVESLDVSLRNGFSLSF